MKAAVLYQAGEIPRYDDIEDPIPQEQELLIRVKAASIKNLDKMRAKGTHYDKHKHYPAVVGVDGVGVLPDGTRVYTSAPYGMMAEKAVIRNRGYVPVPDDLDDITAAALPNPAVSAWLSLSYKGRLKKGDSVLILGATGITGKLAVQIARHLGAGRIIATGRNTEILNSLGADVAIGLNQEEEAIKQAIKAEIQKGPVNVVMDHLWGRPAELTLQALTGKDLHASPDHITRFVQVGEMAGSAINLPAATLRSTTIELVGSGGGGISTEMMHKLYTEIIPEIFRLAAAGSLTIDTLAMPLEAVSAAWVLEAQRRRVVLTL